MKRFLKKSRCWYLRRRRRSFLFDDDDDGGDDGGDVDEELGGRSDGERSLDETIVVVPHLVLLAPAGGLS